MHRLTTTESEEKVIETRQILEELQLKNVLATSSTGAIFLAGDPDTGQDVVIKMVSCGVPNAEEEIRRLFLSMVTAARSTGITGMPALTDHGLTPEGDGFLVMELVEGHTLDSIDELTPFAIVNILLDVLSCLEDLAVSGTAHLNLKPTNVFVTNEPTNDRAVVLGFGTSSTLLHAGAGVPVPAVDPHLAPELVLGNLLADDQGWRSDLFSFGVIACGALGAEIEADGCGRPRVVLPAAVRESLPEAEPLEEILGQIMDPDPMMRGSSPTDIRDPLIRALPDPPEMVASPAPPAMEAPPQVFDPNKTDPAYDPPPVSTSSPKIAATPSVDTIVTDVGVELTDGDGWPEVLFDDPALPASLDDSEDTDVRNPIPGDVWVPEVVEGDAAKLEPAAVAAGSQGLPRKRRVSRIELGLVAAVIVVLVSIIAFTWSGNADDHGMVVASVAEVEQLGPSQALVPPPPDDNLFDDLLAIQQLVDAGDLGGARDELNSMGDRDGISFSSDESALYNSLVTAVARAADRGAAIEDLRSGLQYGSVKMVRRGAAGLAGLNSMEISEVDGLSADLDQAHRILRLHSQMWDAENEGDFLGAIESAGRLEMVMPGYSGAPEVREQSAVALEARAEAYIEDHEYENAVAVLASLRRVWPERTGPEGRIAWCEGQIDSTRHQEALIGNALAKGDDGDPEAGLAILDGMGANTRLRDEIDRARVTLQTRLVEMDAETPTIELATSMELGFKKNETITVPLRIGDDYRVERVVVHARNEADDGFLQIPLESDGEGLYQFTVAPDLHGNKNVYFFVVARDSSGHIGRLGSQEEPRQVTRKKWFKKLL